MAGSSPAMAPVVRLFVFMLARLRGKNHSSHGGRKAYLNFELKDRDRRRRRAFGASLTSKFRYARVSRAMNGVVWPGGHRQNMHLDTRLHYQRYILS